ncbi:hypothetical protein pipiens_000311 [Culex pipiens pipiens]|uniref:Uncharacterized protein n=1 Tax=Culex pipiens pipiens TaxID=38569 RepID=A0ABD1D8J7_CULPP
MAHSKCPRIRRRQANTSDCC